MQVFNNRVVSEVSKFADIGKDELIKATKVAIPLVLFVGLVLGAGSLLVSYGVLSQNAVVFNNIVTAIVQSANSYWIAGAACGGIYLGMVGFGTVYKRVKKNPIMTVKERETEKDWVNRVIKEYGIRGGIRGMKYTGIIPIHLKPEQTGYYKALQDKIAKIIPPEENRVKFRVEIYEGDVRPDGPTLFIMGGMGPKSDAAIVAGAIDKCIKDEKNLLAGRSIVIFSAPAPVRTPDARTALRCFTRNGLKLSPWMRETSDFWEEIAAAQDGSNCIIASNTAHVHLAKEKFHPLRPENETTKCRIIHMVNIISKFLEKYEEVIVLGTQEAADNKLYPKALKGAGIPSTISPNQEWQKELQVVIDGAKQSDEQKKHANAEKLLKIMESCVKESDSSKKRAILLGCTELPMVIDVIVADKTLNDRCKKAIQNIGVFDSEELFSKGVAAWLLFSEGVAAWLKRKE